MRHCHVLLSNEFRELVLCGVTLQQWTRVVNDTAVSAHPKSGFAAPMGFTRFSGIDCCEVVINPCRQFSYSKGSAIFLRGRCQHLKLGNSGILGCRPRLGGLVLPSATTPGIVHLKAVRCSGVHIAPSGRQFCSVSGEEAKLQGERDRRERRLWEKGLRKNIYDSLRKERITVELFPDLSFALDGNYYPKLVPLIAQKINSLLEKGADDEISELFNFLGVSLTPHLVGEVLKSRKDWEKSVRFFVWAQHQPEYEHTAHTYNLLLRNLPKAKNEKLDDVVVALDLLQEMVKEGMAPSIVAVNIVIDRLCKAKKTKAAVRVMRGLRDNGVSLDLVTYNSIINGLGKAGKFKEVFQMLEDMEQMSIKPDLLTYNSIIHSLGNSHRWQEACKMFEELSVRGFTPDVVTYNSLICGLFKAGQVDEALRIFGQMAGSGCEPDVITYNSMIYGFARASRLDDSLKIFAFMKRKNYVPDVCTYNILIGELISRNKFAEVSGLLVEMKEMGCIPDKITRKLLTEIGQADRVSTLWGVEAANGAPADSENISCTSTLQPKADERSDTEEPLSR